MRQNARPQYQPPVQAQPRPVANGQVNGSAPLARANTSAADDMASDAGALVAAGGTLQKLGTGYASAVRVQIPRELEAVKERVIAEAKFAAEDFFYYWEVDKKDTDENGKEIVVKEPIEGPSIHAAMIMVRNWGNCAVPMDLAIDGPQHWVFKASFIDFETGFNLERLFRQRKAAMSGKYENERKQDMAFQIGQSKSQRNVIEKAMPIWLVRDAMEAAKEAARERTSAALEKKTATAIAVFSKRNITQAQLEAKVGALMSEDGPIPAAEWDVECHLRLSGLYNALRDKQTTLEAEFGAQATGAQTGTAEGQPQESQ